MTTHSETITSTTPVDPTIRYAWPVASIVYVQTDGRQARLDEDGGTTLLSQMSPRERAVAIALCETALDRLKGWEA